MTKRIDQSDESPMSDEQLDRLLALAPAEPQRETKRRLRRYVDHLLGRRRTSFPVVGQSVLLRNVASVGAAGLVLMLVVALGWRSYLGSPKLLVEDPVSGSHAVSDTKTAGSADIVSAEANTRASEPAFPVISRVVFVVPRKKPVPLIGNVRRKLSRQVSSWKSAFEAAVDSALKSELALVALERASIALDQHLAAISHHPKDRSALLYKLDRYRYAAQWQFAQRVSSSELSQQERVLAFRRLCRCSTSRTLDFVLEHWQNKVVEDDVIRTARRLADSATVAQMVSATSSSDARIELLAELLQRGDEISVGKFLHVTRRDRLYGAAQKAGRRVRQLPRERLLLALRSNQLGHVRAAAIALSGVDDVSITRRLVKLARNPETSNVAFVALTARQDREAVQFVNAAANDMRWSATVATAQKKWNRLLAIN